MADRKEESIAAFEAERARLKKAGYRETAAVISVFKANVIAFVTAGPFVLLFFVLQTLLWGKAGTFLPHPRQSQQALVLFLLSLPIHEGLHGLGWRLTAKNGFKQIRFGMMWKSLTPYCHCGEPLYAKPYTVGLLLPFFVLGIGLSAASVLLGSSVLFWLGILSFLGAGGDLTIFCYLLRHWNAQILDHPTACGFYAFEKDKEAV